MKRIALLCIPALLTACATPAPAPSAPPAPAPSTAPTPAPTGGGSVGGSAAAGGEAPAPMPRDTCDAARAQPVVGQAPTPSAIERARQLAGADMARVLRHNQPITKEYRIGRLNLVLDEAGQRIARVYCG